MSSEIPKYIYFHICTINNWETICKNMFNHIIDSGLINIVKKINVVVLGNKKNIDKIKNILNHEKVEIIFYSEDTKIYERKTLFLLRIHSEIEEFEVLYIHSKGITKQINVNVKNWCEYLYYFNILKYEKCLEMLKKYDACGVNLNTNNHVHFSGNFWWARSSHIKKLPLHIGANYTDPEFWISKTNEKYNFVSLWNSNINHYESPYPPNNYKNKEIKEIKFSN